MIEISCEKCGKHYRVGDQLAGKRVKCKVCSNPISVPALEPQVPFAQVAELEPAALLEVAPRSDPRRAAPPPIVRCSSCGGVLPPGAILCIDCGVNQQTGRAPAVRSGSGLFTPIAFIPTWVRITIVAVFCLVLCIYGSMIYIGKQAERKRDEFENAQRKTLEGAQDATEQAEKAKAQWARAGISATNVPLQSTATAAPAARAAKPIYWERPRAEVQPGGIEIFYPINISGGGPGLPMRIKLYLPSGRHEKASLPCVFIAPAGTRLIHGASLGRLALDDNSPEHLPYVRAGFAVLNYELSGNLPSSFDAAQMTDAVRRFVEADGGVANGRNAVAYVFEKVPEVDPQRLYVAGHGSAATMALNLCAAYPHFRAVAAYAPVCDVERHDPALLKAVAGSISGMDQFAVRISPLRHAADIHCPVLLFHANDDTVVATADNARFAAAMASAGHPVQFKEVPTGGHYNSMFNEGIPMGIEFFKANGAAPLPPIP